MITVEFADKSGYATSVSDSKNGTHTSIYYVADSADPNYSGIAYFANSLAGSITVKVSLSASDTWALVSAQAWKGAARTSALDAGAVTQHQTSTSGTLANANCGTAQMPSGPGELILSYLVPHHDTSVSAGANFTLTDSPNSTYNPAFPAYWIQTTAQVTNAPFTSAADDFTEGCAAFKAFGAPSASVITTIAGNGYYNNNGNGGPALNASFEAPAGVAVDSAGNIYVTDQQASVIRKIAASTGAISTVAGNGTAGYSGDGGAATSAMLNNPYSITVDSAGNIFIADTLNNRVRKVTASTGKITTIAGTSTNGYSGDGGPATSAKLCDPVGVAVDTAGNIYISDSSNNVIRKVTASTGIITTIVGWSTGLSNPAGLALDSNGHLYIADISNNVVRQLTISTGVVSTVAGNNTAGYSGDGGPATSAQLKWPQAVAVDSAGNVLICERDNNIIRAVSSTSGTIITVAGNGTAGFSGDGGPATSAQLYSPYGIALDASGNFYVGDYANHRIRWVGKPQSYQPPVSVSVSPPSVGLHASNTQQFNATVLNTSNTAVTWSISPAASGTISAAGLYTAPVSITSQQTVTVTATSQVDTGKSASATITLLPPVAVTVSPLTATLTAGQQATFIANVSNTSNSNVTWSITPGVGTISSAGVYTAPSSISTQQTVTVMATSQADSTKSATATVTLVSPVGVSLTPASGTLHSSETLQFTATVTNASDTSVAWALSPAGLGTVSSGGLYTSPSSIATQQTVTVTATSRADSSKIASATVTLSPTLCPANGFSYVRAVTIDHTKVPNTDQANFPFLFSTADTTFATTGNGGHVSNMNAYDLFFSSDPNGQTKLDHELEEYNPATGQVVAWIRIPTLSHTTDTVIYVHYGNPSVTTSQQNPTGVWNNNFVGVWHFQNGTTLSANDSTANGKNGTVTGATLTAGQIGSAANFNGSNNYIVAPLSSTSAVSNGSPFSISLWLKTTSSGGSPFMIATGQGSGSYTPGFLVSGGSIQSYIYPLSEIPGGAVNDGTWHLVTETLAGGTETLYVDGVSKGTAAGNPYNWGSNQLYNVFDFGSQYAGSIDEVRVSGTSLSGDWIATEYKNQSSPSTFYSLSAENITISPSSVSLYAGQAQQFTANDLSGCGTTFVWSMPSGAPGNLTTSGLYTAPATVSSPVTVPITATSQADSTRFETAAVTLLPPVQNAKIIVAPAAQSPYVTGTTQPFTATLTTQDGTPIGNASVTFNVNGVNSGTQNGVTGTGGAAGFSYTGVHSGLDAIQAIATVGGVQISSQTISVNWVTPSVGVSTTTIVGEFFTSDGSGSFDTPATATPVFTQVFPTINFNPPSGSIPGTPSSINVNTRPFTNVTTDLAGNYTGSIIAQGNGYQAGVGPLSTFQAVFRGAFTVAAAGNVTFNFYSDDGFILGIGSGATRVSGASSNMPTVTPFGSFPTMGAYNQTTAPVGNQIVVNFPAAGSYPFELDYTECCAGQEVLTMTQGASSQTGIAPTGTLTLSPNSISALPLGGQQSFTVLATDVAGNPVANTDVSLVITGVDNLELSGKTDSTGHATIVYKDTNPGTAMAQAVAFISGMVTYSNQVAVPWTATASTPPINNNGDGNTMSISVTAPNTVILPSTLPLSATVSDSALAQGGTISVAWSQVSGPGTATFSSPTATSTTASFDKPGGYVFRFGATDPDASDSVQFNVTVNPQPGTTQGWIGSPLSGSSVSGIVPITVASGESLQSGTLTFYPAGNPTSVTVLNPNTTGSGQIGKLDTTGLANGQYWITLQATDSGGNSSYNLTLVTVVGNYKPGRVTSTVTDLVVPAKGLAIKIQRTYDSLNAATSRDFGYGWTLGTNVDLQVNPFGSVTFTVGGQRKTFYLTPQILGWFLPYYVPVFKPEPGLHGTLVPAGAGCSDLFDFLVPDGSLWACVGGGFYTPPGYLYTDPSGTAYTMTASGQLQSIVDKNGNTLTITSTGITSSTGLSVSFNRDSKGRINSITDPKGNVYTYGYLDGNGIDNGNLQIVTYPNTPIASTYTYVPGTHYYQSGTDFRNNPLPNTTYYGSTTDAHGNSLSGKLQSVTDALGEKTSYTYDLATNTTTVTYPPDGGGNVGTATMVYDTMGNVLSSTDPLGHITTNTYDGSQNLLTTTDPLGHKICYTYDGNGNRTSISYPVQQGSACSTVGNITSYNQFSQPTETIDEIGNARYFNYDVNFNPQSVTDGLGTLASFVFNNDGTMQAGAIGYDLSVNPSKASHFAYDSDGNLASRTDALGRTTSYTYNSLGQKTTMVEPLLPGTSAAAATTTYAYDAFGNLTETDAPLGRTTKSTYDGNGNKQDDTDARQHKTSYTYDALNRLTRTDYPDGTYTHKTYDFRGNVIDEWDQALNQTHHVYDLAGREVSVTRAYGTSNAATTGYAYYDDGRKQTETDALTHTTTYNYDIAGDLTGVSGVNGTFTYGYDLARNRTSVTDGDNHTSSYVYDARKRLVETDYPDANHTKKTNGYDGPGNLTSVIDQADNEVDYTYDAANQLQSVVQTSSPTPNNITSYSYDPLGNLMALDDANSHLTESAFDLLSQQTSKTLPDGLVTESRLYDAAGNLTSLTHFNQKTTTYTYDNLNRLLSRAPDVTTGEPTVSFTYTATGKRQTMTDASGTTNYSYDSMDRLITKATPEGTLNYTYDPAGHLATMSSSHANGISVSYTYDSLNRLGTVVDGRLSGNQITTYGYDTASNVASVLYPNGIQYGFNYDELNRLKQIATGQTGYLYNLDAVGNRKSVTELNNRAVNWTYDGIYRLTNETISLDPNNKNGSAGYGLDPVGNRQTATSSIPGLSPISGTFNQDDELASESYDSNGNITASGGKTFSYNTDNQLVSVNGSAVQVVYDGDGNRVKKIVGGVTTQYLVDDLNPTGYSQVVEELTNGAVSRTYTYGLRRISQNQPISNTWTPSFFGYDGFGTVRQLTNSGGTITDTYDYDAFGNKINSTGTTPNSYLYRGEQWDSDLGLYYLRARYYNPLAARFMSRDSFDGYYEVPQTLHKYLYAGGDPVNISDPSGNDDLEEYVRIVIKNNYIGKGKVAYAFGKCIGGVYKEIGDDLSLLLGEPSNARFTSGFRLELNIAGCIVKLVKGARKPPQIPEKPSLGSD